MILSWNETVKLDASLTTLNCVTLQCVDWSCDLHVLTGHVMLSPLPLLCRSGEAVHCGLPVCGLHL